MTSTPGPVIDAYAAVREAVPDFRIFLPRRRFRPAQYPRCRTAGGKPDSSAPSASNATSPLRCEKPSVVGYHWFEHADQPAEGRFDGENSNFGTVTIEDDVYAELTETMTRVNAAAEQIHAEAAHAE